MLSEITLLAVALFQVFPPSIHTLIKKYFLYNKDHYFLLLSVFLLKVLSSKL